MGYRGEDLDIRTPQSRSGSGGVSGDVVLGRHDGPIWVDDTVLACCNHAYEVALAHRSAEVRLEHLLHAMTRVDAAAQVLESQGIRELALRRETATAIASDIPVGLPNGSARPKHSEELEIVLRKAAHVASGHDAPTGIKDLLHVMTDIEPDLRGLELLHRHLAPPPSYNERGGYAPEPRYSSYDMAPREPMRMAPAYYVNESGLPRGRDMRPTVTDNMQNSRLDALEQLMRGLSNDMAAERESFSEILHSLHNDVRAQRDGIDRVSGRLSSSSTVSTEGLEKTTKQLSDRLHDFERSLETHFDSVESAMKTGGGGGADLSPLAHRLEKIEKVISDRDDSVSDTLSDKIATRLKNAFGEGGVSTVAVESQVRTVLDPIAKRLDELHEALNIRQGAAASALNSLSERISDLETSLTRLPSTGGTSTSLNRDELSEVHDALMKLNANQHTLADAVSKWRGDTEDRVSDMSTTIEPVSYTHLTLPTIYSV